MSILVSVHKIVKSMGDRTLFSGLSFGVQEKQRLALLGSNGAGKSTLLKILAGLEDCDAGEVSSKKMLKMAYVAQEDVFDKNTTAIQAASKALVEFGLDNNSAAVQASIYLSMAGFQNLESSISSLSGGWLKRLSLAIAFAKEPDLLLLDEPTNHLDWDGIFWIENQLKTFDKALLLVSHDREFLKNVCNEFMELSRVYQDGYLQLKGSYENFLEKRQQYIDNQKLQQESMANKALRETEWLRAGVKARTTKSQSRIKEAHQLIEDLSEISSRNRSADNKVALSIEQGGKKSKKLIEINNLNIAYGDNQILNNLNIILGPKTRLGLLGANSSGKTSLLKVIARVANNYSGEIKFADDLKILYFDQKRQDLKQDSNIMEYLGDGADHVQVEGRSLHVASYASRFLFDSHRLNLPIERLSGGEQARLLIAKLLLQPADVLLLDEPTNDLDVQTIEILEQSLLQFPGLVIVVSHDRYFLKNTCQKFLALDGLGSWEVYPDLNQWLRSSKKDNPEPIEKIKKPKQKPQRVKLSYMDKRKLENIEKEIAIAESDLEKAQLALESHTDFSDHKKTQDLTAKIQEKQKVVDELYQFWQEMEEKLKTDQ